MNDIKPNIELFCDYCQYRYNQFCQECFTQYYVKHCGGIVNGIDAFEHILCGAKAVQLGTIVMLESLDIFKKVENDLLEIMRGKGYKKISDFCGRLKYVHPDLYCN